MVEKPVQPAYAWRRWSVLLPVLVHRYDVFKILVPHLEYLDLRVFLHFFDEQLSVVQSLPSLHCELEVHALATQVLVAVEQTWALLQV